MSVACLSGFFEPRAWKVRRFARLVARFRGETGLLGNASFLATQMANRKSCELCRLRSWSRGAEVLGTRERTIFPRAKPSQKTFFSFQFSARSGAFFDNSRGLREGEKSSTRGPLARPFDSTASERTIGVSGDREQPMTDAISSVWEARNSNAQVIPSSSLVGHHDGVGCRE